MTRVLTVAHLWVLTVLGALALSGLYPIGYATATQASAQRVPTSSAVVPVQALEPTAGIGEPVMVDLSGIPS